MTVRLLHRVKTDTKSEKHQDTTPLKSNNDKNINRVEKPWQDKTDTK